MLPSPTELAYFIEVTNTLNLSRASERIGISQPSLSVAIKRLEQAVGAAVFIRHKHGVTLTPAGKQLLMHARQLLQYWENTKSQALASHQEVEGHFILGCPSPMAIHIISAFLPELLEKYPKLAIHLKHDLSRKIMEKVINLSIDIGIVANPLKHPDLIIHRLCEDEVTFWVGPGKRKIQDIHSEKVVLLCHPDLIQTQSLLKKIKKRNLLFSRVITMNSLEAVANLTASGCGIGILPSRVANAVYPEKLKRIPNMPVYLDELCLIYRSENRELQAVQKIITTIKNFFNE